MSPADILAASRGAKTLPEKAVLLTFDDAYESFYRFVYPALRLYNIPAVLSVVTSWIDNPETSAYKTKRFMDWPQIREVADSGLVTVASHSARLHRLLQANPVGNVEPAPAAFLYFPESRRYETEPEFRARIREDLAASIDVLTAKLGTKPAILTWPYGSYNAIGVEEAKKLGFEMLLTLDEGYSQVGRLDRVNRYYMESHLDWLEGFKASLARGMREGFRIRGVQVDLDMIVSKNSAEESDKNLGLLLDRLVKLGVNTVFLQGFCDVGATGNVKSLYFANSVLPVEMDFLSHAVNRIRSREMKVFVWMPALAYELPDPVLNEALKVREWKGVKPEVTSSWYRRLSPFDPRSLEATRKIFADLAARVQFDGILIQDDAYLAETEDFHPAAVEAFRRRYGVSPEPEKLKADKELNAKWVAFKTEALDRHIGEIVTDRPDLPSRRRHRPQHLQLRRDEPGCDDVVCPGCQELPQDVRLHGGDGLRGHGGQEGQPQVVPRALHGHGRPGERRPGDLQAAGLRLEGREVGERRGHQRRHYVPAVPGRPACGLLPRQRLPEQAGRRYGGRDPLGQG